MKYYLLAILFGFLMKIYDDLNDNDLYNLFKIPNSVYINEFLKALNYVIFTVICLKYWSFWFIFVLMHILALFFDPKAFSEPYELSGLLASIFMGAFIPLPADWEPITQGILVRWCVYIISSILLLQFDISSGEVSKLKIFHRLFLVTLTIAGIYLFPLFMLPEGIKVVYFFLASYMFTSVIFQLFLINKETFIGFEPKLNNDAKVETDVEDVLEVNDNKDADVSKTDV